jgi:hypothetical protein
VTFGLYFHVGDRNWDELNNDFETRVHSAGFINFSSPFDDSNTSGVDRLTDECISAFGEDEFESKYKNHSRHVDFESIRL